MRVAGLILAGGAGLRLGQRDKALVAVGGRTLVVNAVRRLAPQVGALALSANGDPARFADLGLPVLPDPPGPRAGPVAGVAAGLHWAAAHGLDAIATVAVDTPFFPDDLVARLSGAARGRVALAADGRGLHPTFALWPVTRRADLDGLIARGTLALRAAAAGIGCVTVEFAGDDFFNVNSPADLAEAERRAARAGA